MNRHYVYSLVVESELELPEFPVALDDDRVADVRIVLGRVPDSIAAPLGKGVLYEAGPDEMLLRIPDVASFHVAHGEHITVQLDPDGTAHEARVFMLGSIFGALLQQRGVLVLHAAAMGRVGSTGAEAVCFAGQSGVGKSTLLGEMLRRGRRMIVDDVCAVDDVGGALTVLPGYPRTRLWADSAAKLEVDTDVLLRTRPTIQKFERQVDSSFYADPAPLGTLYVLTAHNADEITITDLDRMNGFRTILANTYRRRYVDELGMSREHFALASRAAAQCRVAVVARPSGRFALEELADAIDAHLDADR